MIKPVRLAFALAGIAVFALALRLWGIGFGLPYAYHIDEPTYVSAALNLGAGVIGRQPNPTGFSNILFGEYAAYYIVGRLGGLFGSMGDFEQAYRMDASAFLLLGRLTSAFFGALTVLAVFWLGKETSGPFAGFLAALSLAAAFLHVRDSHYAVPDITATFFVSLSACLSANAVRRREQRWGLLAAAAGGFAMAVKWSTWPVILPLAAALLLTRDTGWKDAKLTSRVGEWARMSLCLVGGLFLGGFQLAIRPAVYLSYAIHEWQAGQAGGFGIWQIDTVPGWIFYLKTLSCGLGAVLLILGLAGCLRRIAMTLRSWDRMSMLLLSFPLAYYLLMGASRHYFARYALPLTPFMAVFAGEALATAGTWAALRTKSGKGLMALLAAAAIAQPLALSVRHDVLLTRPDTRTLAKRWIEENISEGSRIAVDWPVHGPPLSTLDKAAPGSDRVYQVEVIGGAGLSDHPLTWYRQEGFDYLVASSFICNIHLVCEEEDEQRHAFYASLDEAFELVQEFHPCKDEAGAPFVFDEIYGPMAGLWQRERPGPTLKIYRVTP